MNSVFSSKMFNRFETFIIILLPGSVEVQHKTIFFYTGIFSSVLSVLTFVCTCHVLFSLTYKQEVWLPIQPASTYHLFLKCILPNHGTMAIVIYSSFLYNVGVCLCCSSVVLLCDRFSSYS